MIKVTVTVTDNDDDNETIMMMIMIMIMIVIIDIIRTYLTRITASVLEKTAINAGAAKKKKKLSSDSHTGSRTRAAWVKTRNPNR